MRQQNLDSLPARHINCLTMRVPPPPPESFLLPGVTAARSKISKNNSLFCQIKLGQSMFAPPASLYTSSPARRPPKFLALRKREVCCVGHSRVLRRADKRKWVRLLLSSPQSITSPLAPRLR